MHWALFCQWAFCVDSCTAGVLRLFEFVYDVLVGYYFVVQGTDMIHNRYVKADEKSFTILSPGKKHHMVVSSRHIEELNRAPLDVLSLHAVAKDFIQPKDTMHGFEWNVIRGQEGTGFVRALRHVLTSRLPQLRPAMHRSISHAIESHLVVNETKLGSEIFELPVYAMTKMIVAKVNCLVFFGPRLTADSRFLEAAAAFPHEPGLAAEIIRIWPCALTRWVAQFMTGNYPASKSFHALLCEEVERRVNVADGHEGNTTDAEGKGEYNDLLQWLIDTSLRKQNWDTARMVGEVMGVWYGAVHTLSISTSFALLDLYTRSDQYVEPLRAELAAQPLSQQPGHPSDLPLMDAFLKESARLSAFESLAVRREALQPFRFSDGLRVEKGDWIGVPTRSMMRDPARIANALEFDAWRHVSPSADKKVALFTDYQGFDGDGTMIWGLSRITCPGRFFAALTMKIVLGVFLEHYEVELLDTKADMSLQWRSSIVPKSTVRMRVRKRGEIESSCQYLVAD